METREDGVLPSHQLTQFEQCCLSSHLRSKYSAVGPFTSARSSKQLLSILSRSEEASLSLSRSSSMPLSKERFETCRLSIRSFSLFVHCWMVDASFDNRSASMSDVSGASGREFTRQGRITNLIGTLEKVMKSAAPANQILYIANITEQRVFASIWAFSSLN